MRAANSQFLVNINRVKELHSLYQFLKQNQDVSRDLSDLLRGEIVYAVSALDKLVHELVRIGMLKSFSGDRSQTPSFDKFSVSLKSLEKIKATAIQRSMSPGIPPLAPDDLPEYWFEQEIVQRHKALSFQDPKKIADGLSLIWGAAHKWQEISKLVGSSEQDVKTELELIVGRRNLIVHEADINAQTGEKNIIEELDVSQSVEFIAKLGNAIYDCVK